MSANWIFTLLVASGFIALTGTQASALTYEIESDKSRIRFEIGHHNYVKPVRGRFSSLTGQINYDPEDPEALEVDVAIDAASVDTDNQYRDGHLRASFFETDKFPEIYFHVTRVLLDEEAVEGELTLKGVSRMLTLDVSNVRDFVDAAGDRVLRFHASGHINRRDFGVVENADDATGLEKILANIQEGLDQFIDDEVEIKISVFARETYGGALAGDRFASLR